mmetsp:Transcript_524/g.1445  ORF Transcript_524/g.1445 Transcript_524/m.1445 type:complete len:264 (-) Transcript_524:476-1267(-)
MERGTPTCSIERLGSGVMTVRAEKSTRFPIRLPRTRPCFPFSRSEIALSGRPDLVVACRGTSGELLVISVAWWYCSRRANSAMMCEGAPFCSLTLSIVFALMMSASLCVMSSSDLPPPAETPGRTCGGGMGSTLTSSHSGRQLVGSSPSSWQCASEILEKIWCARSASTTCFSFTVPFSLNSNMNCNSGGESRRTVEGCTCPQPNSSLQTLYDWQTRTTSAMRRSARLRCSAMIRSSSSGASRREQLQQTARSSFCTVLRKPM